MRAFGLASRRVFGVIWSTPCRFQTEPRSLAPSGVKGRSIGLIDPSKRVINTVEIAKSWVHTGFLEEPVDLVLMDPVVIGTVE